VSWQVALGGLLVGGAIAAALRSFVAYARRNARRATKVQRELLALFLDALRNAKPLKAMAREGALVALLHRQIARFRKLQRRAALNREAMASLQDAAAAAVLCAAI